MLYRESDIVTLESQSGFLLQCNMKFDICLLEVSGKHNIPTLRDRTNMHPLGWYFGKTAGLWGTVNNEPSDDLLKADGTRARADEIGKFTDSWVLGNECSSKDRAKTTAMVDAHPADEEVRELCEAIFNSKVSPFVTCFTRIPSEPFLNMCLNSTTEEEACTAAVAYMNLCSYANTPLRIPDSCVK